MGEAMSKTNWRNRVKALEYHVAGDIQDHPHQWRTHPARQAEAHFAMGRRVRDEAKAACAEANTAGAAWMGMVSKPRATWET